MPVLGEAGPCDSVTPWGHHHLGHAGSASSELTHIPIPPGAPDSPSSHGSSLIFPPSIPRFVNFGAPTRLTDGQRGAVWMRRCCGIAASRGRQRAVWHGKAANPVKFGIPWENKGLSTTREEQNLGTAGVDYDGVVARKLWLHWCISAHNKHCSCCPRIPS